MEDLEALLGSESPSLSGDFRLRVEAAVRWLLLNRPERLFQVLYRIDVPEKGLRQTLAENPGADAAVLVTNLILRRMQEKAESRARFRDDREIPEEDKW
jgi:hypothetical protein